MIYVGNDGIGVVYWGKWDVDFCWVRALVKIGCFGGWGVCNLVYLEVILVILGYYEMYIGKCRRVLRINW